MNKEDATVSEIEDAHAKLQEARKNLVLKATDTEVKALENKVASFKEDDYTASSYKAFLPVLEEVKEALKAEHTSEEITALTEKLDAASKKLVRRGNTAELDLLLAQAKNTDSKLYTQKSYKNLLEVIKAIEEELENKEELTQEEVDALTKQLSDAVAQLEKNPEITPETPSKPSTPSKPENPSKPSKPGTGTETTKPNKKPQTGDSTMLGFAAFFTMISLLGYVLLKKKEA